MVCYVMDIDTNDVMFGTHVKDNFIEKAKSIIVDTIGLVVTYMV